MEQLTDGWSHPDRYILFGCYSISVASVGMGWRPTHCHIKKPPGKATVVYLFLLFLSMGSTLYGKVLSIFSSPEPKASGSL